MDKQELLKKRNRTHRDDNYLSINRSCARSAQPTSFNPLGYNKADKRAKRLCKATIIEKLKKSKYGRQLLLGRQLFKKGNGNTQKGCVHLYLQHKAARRLAAISFNNVFSLGSRQLATKLFNTSFFTPANSSNKLAKRTNHMSLAMLLQKIIQPIPVQSMNDVQTVRSSELDEESRNGIDSNANDSCNTTNCPNQGTLYSSISYEPDVCQSSSSQTEFLTGQTTKDDTRNGAI